jgi:hypothetical protein
MVQLTIEISDLFQTYNEFIKSSVLIGMKKQVELLEIAHIQLTCQINDYGVFLIPVIDIDFSHQSHIYLCIFSLKITFELKNANET